MNDAKIDQIMDILGDMKADRANPKDAPRIVAEHVDGVWMAVPLTINGKEYTSIEATRYLRSNEWVDPRTGIDWSTTYESKEEAESAIRQRLERMDTDRAKVEKPREEIMGPLIGDGDMNESA